MMGPYQRSVGFRLGEQMADPTPRSPRPVGIELKRYWASMHRIRSIWLMAKDSLQLCMRLAEHVTWPGCACCMYT